MNPTEIQRRLDETVHAIKIGGPYREFAIDRLYMAVQLLVNELARIQPEHPELTEASKLGEPCHADVLLEIANS